ncbi:hypothetical protein HY501_01565 [Candidatus Woesearchaeota archaeon]|nr:hypothetical protein [Candidatus Woesearchaeota archaeon]
MVKEKRFLDFNKAILLLLIISIFIIIKAALAPPTSSLEQEANIVIAKLTDGNAETSLLSSDQIDIEKLRMLNKMEYGSVKNILGVKSDFCIYFEDATGNIVQIDNISQGIGSDKISINGEPCR